MSEAEIETGKAFAIECCERLAGARGWTVTGCAWLPLDDHLEYPLRVTIAGRAQPISIYIARRVIEDSDAQEIEQTARAAYARAALHPRELDARVEEAVFSRTVRRLRAPDDYDGAQPDTDDQDELHDPPVRRWSSDAEASRELWEKLGEDDRLPSIITESVEIIASVLGPDNDRVYATAPTRAEALARAAVLAYGGTLEA